MSPNTLLLILLVALVFTVGFLFGMLSDLDLINGTEAPSAANGTTDTDTATNSPRMTSDEAGTETDTSDLIESQRQLLENLGVDADEITITEEMAACAHAEVGSVRLREIQNGAEPSFAEGAKLLACYSGD